MSSSSRVLIVGALVALFFASVQVGALSNERVRAHVVSAVEPSTRRVRYERFSLGEDHDARDSKRRYSADTVATMMGRSYTDEYGSIAFDWSGVTASVEFTGTLVNLTLLDTGENMMSVAIDDDFDSNFTTATGAYTYSFSNLQDGPHTVTLRKLTESNQGVVTFSLATWLDESGLQAGGRVRRADGPMNPDGPRFVFYGDSVTVGYGVSGTYPCSFSIYTENIDLAYPKLVSDFFEGNFHVEAISGKGVVRNWGWPNQTAPDPLPIYLNRTIGQWPEFIWDFQDYVPDIVVIHLGGNDYTTQPHPVNSTWIEGYTSMVDNVFTHWPSANLFHLCGPMPGDPCGEVQTVLNAWNEKNDSAQCHYVDAQNLYSCPDGCGCDGHPNAYVHGQLAYLLQNAIADSGVLQK